MEPCSDNLERYGGAQCKLLNEVLDMGLIGLSQCFCPSALCSQTLIPMIPWCLRLLMSTRRTAQGTSLQRGNGPESTPFRIEVGERMVLGEKLRTEGAARGHGQRLLKSTLEKAYTIRHRSEAVERTSDFLVPWSYP